MAESETFTCEMCRQTFPKGRPDEEANAEAEELWGVENASEDAEMAVVCDDCFKKMLAAEAEA